MYDLCACTCTCTCLYDNVFYTKCTGTLGCVGRVGRP